VGLIRTLVVVTLVGAVAFAGGLAVAGGYGPVPDAGLPQPSDGGGGDGADLSDEEFPTATPTPSDGGGGGGDDTPAESSGGDATTDTATPEPAPFDVSIVNIEECGETCRDVTVDLTNQQDTDATGVTVYTRIFAGNGTDGDQVWSGEESVGTLAAGETHTGTKRVELGLSDALAVDNADGWITIQTTIETDDQTVTFTERRQVA
jgi:hypothetical protein